MGWAPSGAFGVGDIGGEVEGFGGVGEAPASEFKRIRGGSLDPDDEEFPAII